MLTTRYESLLNCWETFSQSRVRERAVAHAMAMTCVLGRRTVSRTLCALGRANQDWSADYRMFSRSPWDADSLFSPVLDGYLMRYGEGTIAVAIDDTKLAKTGKKIASAGWHRDPLSPPFHTNFLYGLRFLQASLLFPHHQEGDFAARALPISFQEAPPVKKPGKRAGPEQRAEYNRARRQKNLSTDALALIEGLRVRFDQKGADHRTLLATLDGSFCNQTIFKQRFDRTELIARCRKDARLCFAGTGRRKYAPHRFTPENVRQDENIVWQVARVHYGGAFREMRYKQVEQVLWRRGAATRPLRLMVIAPMPYKLSKQSRVNYREPAYLLTTDLVSSPAALLQAYIDRWQIELNHREEKDLLGIGQAQVRAVQSVPRLPAFAVACYSLLHLAGLQEFGLGRTEDFIPLPKWRRNAKRASLLDLLSLLRNENNETSISPVLTQDFAKNLSLYAAT
jgi:DDE superfamily endonuclease